MRLCFETGATVEFLMLLKHGAFSLARSINPLKICILAQFSHRLHGAWRLLRLLCSFKQNVLDFKQACIVCFARSH